MNTATKDGFNHGLQSFLDRERKLERADLVWSRMTLEPHEVLFVKVSLASSEYAGAINEMIEKAFGPIARDRVIVYIDGSLELTKINISQRSSL